MLLQCGAFAFDLESALFVEVKAFTFGMLLDSNLEMLS